MKKVFSLLTVRISLFLVALVAGLTAVFLYPRMFPTTVTLCQIAQNPEFYDGMYVSVEADGYSYMSTLQIRDEGCPDLEAWADVSVPDGYLRSSAELALLVDAPLTTSRSARVVVTGVYDIRKTRSGLGPPAAIRSSSVALKTDIATVLVENLRPDLVTRQDVEIRKFFVRFQVALWRDDRIEVMSMMSPVVNAQFYDDGRGPGLHRIENPKDFSKVYDKVFNPVVKDYFLRMDPQNIIGMPYYMYTGTGEIGISSECKADPDTCTWNFKVRDIFARSIYSQMTNPNYPVGE